MKVTLTVSKAELEIIVRGIASVLIDENNKSGRRAAGWKATRAYLVAEALELRLKQLAEECAHATNRR